MLVLPRHARHVGYALADLFILKSLRHDGTLHQLVALVRTGVTPSPQGRPSGGLRFRRHGRLFVREEVAERDPWVAVDHAGTILAVDVSARLNVASIVLKCARAAPKSRLHEDLSLHGTLHTKAHSFAM